MPITAPVAAICDELGHMYCMDCADNRDGVRIYADNAFAEEFPCDGCGGEILERCRECGTHIPRDQYWCARCKPCREEMGDRDPQFYPWRG